MFDLYDRFQHEQAGAIMQIIEFIEQIAFWEHLTQYLDPDEAHQTHTAHMDMVLEDKFPPIIKAIIYLE